MFAHRIIPADDCGVTDHVDAFVKQICEVIVGKDQAVKLAVACLLARGHLLIEDIPGVGKTTLSQALARSLALAFQRLQFTSDLLPADILGNSIFDYMAWTKSNLLSNFMEGNPVVPQVFFPADVFNVSIWGVHSNALDNVALTKILIRRADVENLRLVGLRCAQHLTNRPCCIAHVYVRSPELFAKNNQMFFG